MRKNYLKDRVGESRELEDISWQFGCNLTCAGWRELPKLADKNGQMYQKARCRVYLDNIGVIVYFRDRVTNQWVRLFGQSFDAMGNLDTNFLIYTPEPVYPVAVDLMTGQVA